MAWETTKHPRGGQTDNPGQFSSGWGSAAKKQNLAIYRARAHQGYLAAQQRGDKSAAKKFRYYELHQKKAMGQRLSQNEQAQFQAGYNELMRTNSTARALQGTGSLGLLAASSLVGPLGITGATVLAGSSLAAINIGRNVALGGEREALGVHGFKRDGQLSVAEQNALSAVVYSAVIGGAVTLDRKMHTNVRGITSDRMLTMLGRSDVTRNLRPSAQGGTERFDRLMRGSTESGWFGNNTGGRLSASQGMNRVIKARRLKELQLTRVGVSNMDSHYYGNPFKGGGARAYHAAAVRTLGIKDPLLGHYQLRGTTINPAMAGGRAEKYIKIQYEETQRLLKDLGITHVDVTRGMAVDKATIRRMKISPVESLGPGSTPWVRGDIRLQSLNSFSTRPDMAMDYALNNVGGIGNWGSGNLAVIIRARVPADRVYSFAGFGPGHGSEMVITGGWLNNVEMMVVDPSKIMTKTQRVTGNLGRSTGSTSPTMQRLREIWDWNMADNVQKNAFGVEDDRIYKGATDAFTVTAPFKAKKGKKVETTARAFGRGTAEATGGAIGGAAIGAGIGALTHKPGAVLAGAGAGEVGGGLTGAYHGTYRSMQNSRAKGNVKPKGYRKQAKQQQSMIKSADPFEVEKAFNPFKKVKAVGGGMKHLKDFHNPSTGVGGSMSPFDPATSTQKAKIAAMKKAPVNAAGQRKAVAIRRQVAGL